MIYRSYTGGTKTGEEEINEEGERDGQGGKDNEVKTIVTEPIGKIDTRVGGFELLK